MRDSGVGLHGACEPAAALPRGAETGGGGGAVTAGANGIAGSVAGRIGVPAAGVGAFAAACGDVAGSGAVNGGITSLAVASEGPSGASMRSTSSASPTTTRSPSASGISPSTRWPLTKVPLLDPRSRSRTFPGATTKMACWRLTVVSAICTRQARLRPMTDSPFGSSIGALPGTSTKICQPVWLT